MVRILYGDILLLIDFCMNFFVLYTTGIILRRHVKMICMFFASLIGGIYSVAKIFISGNDVVDCLISLSVGFLMCYICFGAYSFFKTAIVFLGTSALVGGIMFGAYFLLGSYHTEIYGDTIEYAYSHVPVWLFIVLAFVSMIISWLFSYIGRERSEEIEQEVYIEYHGKKIKTKLLLDTGNLAKEPISGLNVILIDKQTAKNIIGLELYKAVMNHSTAELLSNRFRLICASGIDGIKHTYFAFLPEKILLKRRNNEVELKAYIGICEAEVAFGDCNGLIHPSVIV